MMEGLGHIETPQAYPAPYLSSNGKNHTFLRRRNMEGKGQVRDQYGLGLSEEYCTWGTVAEPSWKCCSECVFLLCESTLFPNTAQLPLLTSGLRVRFFGLAK
jgi:hypothetical protein